MLVAPISCNGSVAFDLPLVAGQVEEWGQAGSDLWLVICGTRLPLPMGAVSLEKENFEERLVWWCFELSVFLYGVVCNGVDIKKGHVPTQP